MAAGGNVPVLDSASQAVEQKANADMHVQAATVAAEQLNEPPPVAKPTLFESAVSAPPPSVAAERGGTLLLSGTTPTMTAPTLSATTTAHTPAPTTPPAAIPTSSATPEKDRGNSSQQTTRAAGARANRKSGTLAQMTDDRRESNGTLTKGDRAPPPGKLQHMMHLMSRAEGKSSLSIEASVRGSLKVWNVDVPSNVALRDVVSSWAGAMQQQVGLEAAHVTGRSGGPALNLDSKIVALRPQLPIRGGRLGLVVSMPSQTEAKLQQQNSKDRARASAKGALSKLHFSACMTDLDLKIFGTRSKTMQEKIASGRYGQAGARGVQLPCGLGDAMKPSPSAPICGGRDGDWRGPLEDRELVVYSHQKEDVELFRVRLSGPRVQIENWAATAKKFESVRTSTDGPGKSITSVPFPVFMPSQSRAKIAHLNWEAPHVFGMPSQDMAPGSWPVVIAVVEPDEEEDYRKVWPGALLLVLPKKKRGPSYVRWIIQRICTKSFEWRAVNQKRSKIGPLRQLPWCWICDDNLISFFRLVSIRKAPEPRGTTVGKKREWGTKTPMFWEAMVAVQQHPNFHKFALCGFLRDDGTATCKTQDWTYDVLSLYKVVLLNNRELRRLRVEYLPGLQKYEDLYFNSEVQRQGGQMLKCQCYCFRAGSGSSKHGKRRRELRDTPAELMPGLMDAQHYSALGVQERASVKLLSDLMKHKERKCAARRDQLEEFEGNSKRARQDQNGSPVTDEKHTV